MKNLNKVLLQVGEEHKGMVKFPVTENKTFLETPIEELCFDVRSYNVLKRYDKGSIKTVKDIIANLSTLHKSRGCGTKTMSRIMYQICQYNYSQLSPKEKEKYLNKIIELNK